MNSIIQSVFASLLGLALSVLGIVHSVNRYPGSQVFAQVFSLLPSIGSALFFVLGIIAAIGGMVMLWLSIRRLMHRWHHLQLLTSPRRSPHNGQNGQYREDEEWAGAYR